VDGHGTRAKKLGCNESERSAATVNKVPDKNLFDILADEMTVHTIMSHLRDENPLAKRALAGQSLVGHCIREDTSGLEGLATATRSNFHAVANSIYVN
jgi:hypothetical protein